MSSEWRSLASILITGIVAGFIGLVAVPVAVVGAAWWGFGGPPLDFDAPHNGRVVAHIDVLASIPPDTAGIRGMTNDVHPGVIKAGRESSPYSLSWLQG